MDRKGAKRDQVLPLLGEAGVLSPEIASEVSAQTGVPAADVWGAANFYSLIARPAAGLRVCRSISCQLEGADEWLAELEAAGVKCEGVSCLGQCDRGPIAMDDDRTLKTRGADGVGPAAPRGPVTPADPALAIDLSGEDDASYAALARAREIGGEAVLDQVKAAGLQGRGGAGFPTWIKWRGVRGQAEPERFLVINADEGEPGTFKDREVMLRRPHRMIEGAAIAAMCVGARVVYLYVRGEFAGPRRAVEAALLQARPHLGDLQFRIFEGQGAYICGEETALLNSIEGRRGEPRMKPPYPHESGLFGMPTLIQNVETLACVPSIVLRGGEWFKAQGRTEPGTKLYCVSGHVERPGVYELPLGVSLDELVEAAGGYVGAPHAFCPGGASAGFLPISERSRPLDFRGLAEVGSMLGSAGIVVLNDTVDMAEATRWLAEFFEEESCGQCAPCRIGTRLVRRALDRYLDSGDAEGALRHMDAVTWEMEEGSICGLGVAAALPLISARKHFPEAFGPRDSQEDPR